MIEIFCIIALAYSAGLGILTLFVVRGGKIDHTHREGRDPE